MAKLTPSEYLKRYWKDRDVYAMTDDETNTITTFHKLWDDGKSRETVDTYALLLRARRLGYNIVRTKEILNA